MPRTYTKDEEFTEYDSRESNLIECWLKEHGYEWWQPTLCGSHCGMFEKYYNVGGLRAKWDTEKDLQDFIDFAEINNIPYNEFNIDDGVINPKV